MHMGQWRLWVLDPSLIGHAERRSGSVLYQLYHTGRLIATEKKVTGILIYIPHIAVIMYLTIYQQSTHHKKQVDVYISEQNTLLLQSRLGIVSL